MAKEKTAFLIYEDWETLFNSLDNNDEAGQLIKSLFAFAKRGEVAKFKGALKMAFIVMSQQIARDNNRYSVKCERNKQIALEREEQKRLERLKNSTDVHERARTYTNSTYTDTDTDTDTDVKKHTEKLKPPTLEEIKAYCKERNNNIDAEAFFDYYTANGWVQGNQNKPLKDWKAAVKLWEKNKFSEKKDNTGTDIEDYKSVINKFLY